MFKYLFVLMFSFISAGILEAQEEEKGFAIVLDGLSSCGKSSTSRELRHMFDKEDTPVMIFSTDMLMQDFSKKYQNIDSGDKVSDPVKEGIKFYVDENGVFQIQVGEVIQKLFAAVPEMILALLDEGNNVIVDGALVNPVTMEKFRKYQKDYDITTVKVWCGEARSTKRENERDGFIGLAAALRSDKRFFQGTYDYTLYTDGKSKKVRAKEVMDFFKIRVPLLTEKQQ
jgi:chloramphenicol 3-O-phosphotransferase